MPSTFPSVQESVVSFSSTFAQELRPTFSSEGTLLATDDELRYMLSLPSLARPDACKVIRAFNRAFRGLTVKSIASALYVGERMVEDWLRFRPGAKGLSGTRLAALMNFIRKNEFSELSVNDFLIWRTCWISEVLGA